MTEDLLSQPDPTSRRTALATPSRPTSSVSAALVERPRPRRSFGRWFGSTGWRHLVAIIVSIFAVFPILYVVSASLNPRGTLTGTNQLFSAIGFDSYVRILTDPQIPYPMWFLNTLLVATVTGVTMVIIGALAAYAFSRMRF